MTNIVFMTFLGFIVGGFFAPSCGTDCAVAWAASGGGVGLLIGCLLNRKAPPLTPRDDTPPTDPLVE